MYTDPYSLGPRLFASEIKFIDLFHYIPWVEKEVISRIKAELKWDYPKHLKSNWRFDCRIGHIKDYLYMKTINMTEKDDLYAKMVREGLITRNEALRRLREENKIYDNEIKELFEKVDIINNEILDNK